MLKYSPMSKEFQREAEKLGLTGNQLIQKYRKEEKLKSIKVANDEWYQKKGFKNLLDYDNSKKGFKNLLDYDNSLAIQKGFKDKKDRNREWHYDKGSLPMSVNIDCSEYLGVHIAERQIARKILPDIFGCIAKEMSYGNKGFDFICNENEIDVKSTSINGLNKLMFHIRWNRIASHFLLIGFDRKKEKILGIWLIDANENIRNSRLRDKETITIKYDKKYLLPFKKYEITERFVRNGILI